MTSRNEKSLKGQQTPNSNRKPAKKACENGFHKYKSKWEAIRDADLKYPDETIPEVLRFHGCKTPQDARDFVFFNLLRNIYEQLMHSNEDAHLLRIQERFFHSTFK